MYEITRRVQRHKLHTEFFISYSSLPDNPDRAWKYQPLIRFDESSFQPNAELVSENVEKTEIIWVLLDGSMEFRTSSKDWLTVQKNQMCRAVIGSPTSVRTKNPSMQAAAKFLEIWLALDESAEPDIQVGDCKLSPGSNSFLTIASGQDHPDSLSLNHDAAIHYFQLQPNESFIFETLQYRSSYIWVLKGAMSIDDYRILNQDGVIITGYPTLTLNAQQHTTALLIDLPGDPPLDDLEDSQPEAY